MTCWNAECFHRSLDNSRAFKASIFIIAYLGILRSTVRSRVVVRKGVVNKKWRVLRAAASLEPRRYADLTSSSSISNCEIAWAT